MNTDKHNPPTRPYFAPALPTLSPGLLVPRTGEGDMARTFPFNAPGARYYYFGRNALWAVCKLLNLAGGEVVAPAYHHGVEIATLVAAGVEPVFYRVDRRWQVDLEDVERRITPQTRALYLVHYAGLPGPAAEMKAITDRHGLPLIEDCALSLLAKDGSRPIGVTGDVAFFSIYKMLPVPNGGVLVLNGALAQRAGELARPAPPPRLSTTSHVLSSLLQHIEMRGGKAGQAVRKAVRRVGRGAVQTAGLERVTTGSDEFDPAAAHLGISKLSMSLLHRLNMERAARLRRRNYRYLLNRLRDVAPPIMDQLPDGACPLFYPVISPNKVEIVEQLQARGISAVDFWHFFHLTCDGAQFPDEAWLRSTVFEVPCHQDLTVPVMDYIARTVREVMAR